MGALIALGATAVLGGGLSLFSDYMNRKSAEDANKSRSEAIANERQNYDAQMRELEDLINKRYSHAGEDASQYANQQYYANYLAKLRSSDMTGLVNDYYGKMGDGKFEYGKSIEDFMDPRAEVLAQRMGNAAIGRSVGQGMGHSYDAARAYGQAVADKTEQLYGNALNAYNADRSQSFNEWNSYLQNQQNRLSNLMQAQQNDISNLGTVANMYTNEQQNQFEDMMNLRMAGINGSLQWGALGANSQQALPGYNLGNAFSVGAQGAGAAANIYDKARAW